MILKIGGIQLKKINMKKEKVVKNIEPKKKYWYMIDIEVCVLCGKERKSRYRVFEKPEFNINMTEFACNEHFM